MLQISLYKKLSVVMACACLIFSGNANSQSVRWSMINGVSFWFEKIFSTFYSSTCSSAAATAMATGNKTERYNVSWLAGDPKNGKWDGPDVALTCVYDSDLDDANIEKIQTYHYSVKSERYRYTLYSNDAEELYDHKNDRHEWYNLAGDQKYKKVKKQMKQKLFNLLGDNPNQKRGIS